MPTKARSGPFSRRNPGIIPDGIEARIKIFTKRICYAIFNSGVRVMASILKLKRHSWSKEAEFELKYLASLSIKDRFKMMMKKSKEMVRLLEQGGHRRPFEVIKAHLINTPDSLILLGGWRSTKQRRPGRLLRPLKWHSNDDL
jgi:hypothetical protein